MITITEFTRTPKNGDKVVCLYEEKFVIGTVLKFDQSREVVIVEIDECIYEYYLNEIFDANKLENDEDFISCKKVYLQIEIYE